MSLPNFLCVGAQKAGTTTLQEILIQHPDIYLPKIKETHFFDNGDLHYNMGLSWYEKEYFSAVKNEKAVGEISTNYMFLDYVPQRIYEDLGPDIKFVFMLRNPVDRTFSQYMMARKNFLETESFETALSLEEKRSREGEFRQKNNGYLQRGFYAEQVKRFLEYFPKEQMHFIIFETEFIPKRAKTIQDLCQFLGVSLYTFDLDIQKNVMRDPGSATLHRILHDPGFAWMRKPFKLLIPSLKVRERIKAKVRWWQGKKISDKKSLKMDDSIREELLEKFRDDILELQKLIGKDLTHWLKA